MDRLQAAIARARSARDALAAQSFVAPKAEAPALSAWDDLDLVELDEAQLAASRIVTRNPGPRTAPFDVLRTRVTQQMRSNGWRRLSITSPTAECGKSTVTLNLAFSLARQTELRIFVVDFDLRRPSLARLLGLGSQCQVSRALEGRTTIADETVRIADNLAIATASRAVRNPAELLQGRNIDTALAEIDTAFAPDIILFDLPPVMVSDDAIGFLPHGDCALMIAAAEQSTIRQVDTCEQELAAQTNVLGVVLNKCDHPGEGYGYGYEYDYADDA